MVNEKTRTEITAFMDIFVSLFILILGGLIFIFSLTWGDFVDSLTSPAGVISAVTVCEKTIWIVTIASIGTMVYAGKRMLDDILKIITQD